MNVYGISASSRSNTVRSDMVSGIKIGCLSKVDKVGGTDMGKIGPPGVI